MDIQVTDRYIYTVFDGMSWKERDAFYQRGEAPQEEDVIYMSLIHKEKTPTKIHIR